MTCVHVQVQDARVRQKHALVRAIVTARKRVTVAVMCNRFHKEKVVYWY